MGPYDRWWIATLVLIGVAGCSTPIADIYDRWRPPPTHLAERHASYSPPIDPSDHYQTDAFSPTDSREELTLGQVIQRVLKDSPELAGFAWEVRAAEARMLQASVFPNPQIGVEVENFAGSGDLSGFDAAETTVTLSQVFPLGKKVERQTELAVLDRDLAGWDYEARRTEVLVETTRRFVNVLAAQRQIQLARQSQQLAALVHEAVTKRVDAGDAAPTQATRTGVLLAMSRVDVQRAQQALQAARFRLANMWGGAADRFEAVAGTLNRVTAIPPLEALDHWINENPQMARWASRIAQHRANVEAARAEGVPDLEVEGGVRYVSESDDAALVVGVSLPLPLFDQNKGGVLEARYNLAKADTQRQATAVRLRASLVAAYQELVSAYAEATALRDDVLPVARSAFEAVQSAFDQGGGGYLDMLDAQQILTDVRRQYVDSLARYHRAAAGVEGLIGRPLHTLDDPVDTKSELETFGSPGPSGSLTPTRPHGDIP